MRKIEQIFLYTGSYPFGLLVESFLGPELSIISTDKYYDITVVPVIKESSSKRKIPNGIKLDDSICESGLLYKLSAFLHVFSLWTLRQTWSDRKNLTRPIYFFHLIKYTYAANLIYKHVCQRANNTNKVVFYSYWMAYAPIAFSKYKQKYPKSPHRFITRGHGGDVYSTDRGIYYPFRCFSLSFIDHVYVVSKYGRDYIQQKFPQFKEKISHSYLGVLPNEKESLKFDECVKLVSCSNVYDFKRVDLLFKSIEKFAADHPDMNFEWTHYGDGDMFEDLKEEVTNNHFQKNLKVILMGDIKNEEVLKNYRQRAYNVFLHASTTEGLPVSMMEALASSIPVISTAVGGVPEIVTENTGRLLDVNFSQQDFDRALTFVIQNNDVLSHNAYIQFNNNFNALVNYVDFYKQIVSL